MVRTPPIHQFLAKKCLLLYFFFNDSTIREKISGIQSLYIDKRRPPVRAHVISSKSILTISIIFLLFLFRGTSFKCLNFNVCFFLFCVFRAISGQTSRRQKSYVRFLSFLFFFFQPGEIVTHLFVLAFPICSFLPAFKTK